MLFVKLIILQGEVFYVRNFGYRVGRIVPHPLHSDAVTDGNVGVADFFLADVDKFGATEVNRLVTAVNRFYDKVVGVFRGHFSEKRSKSLLDRGVPN